MLMEWKKLNRKKKAIKKKLDAVVSEAYGMKVHVGGRFDIRYAINKLKKAGKKTSQFKQKATRLWNTFVKLDKQSQKAARKK